MDKFTFLISKKGLFISKLYNIKSRIFIPDIGMIIRVFTNGPEDQHSIPGRVIPKAQKMVLDASLLNTQQ